MKAFKTLLFLVSFTVTFFSCSKDNEVEFNDIRGVWDTVEVNGDQVETIRLVFGENNFGAEIFNAELVTGELSSTITSFNWIENNDIIEILDGIEVKETYFLNASGQLILESDENLVFTKTSEDYSKY